LKVVVTGAHGFIGSQLVATLERSGDEVTRLVRAGASGPRPGQGRTAAWDIPRGTIDRGALEGHDAVVHLAGAGLGDHRWTAAYRREIHDSRARGTSLLAETIATLEHPPRVLVSASAVGWYGDRGDEELTEASGPGSGFLADVVKAWEAATEPARAAGIRVVRLRSGVVLSPRGGALKKQLLPFRLGAGGRLGSGRQWLSWIALDDEVAAIVHLLRSDTLRGPVNATAPVPVTNAAFTHALGAVLRRPTFLTVPAAALKVAFGRLMAEEMLLAGQRVLPRALEASGFTFRHPRVDQALRSMLAR
jgi:uncharacterized protein (TIGR01777 family)